MSNRTDNFNRANNSSSLGTPSDSGSGYTVYTGTGGLTALFGISSNHAYLAQGDFMSWATLQTGGTPSADVSVKATLSNGFNGNGYQSGVCARVSDGDNGIYARLRDSENTVQLVKRVANSNTQLGLVSHTPADGDQIELVVNGSSVSVKVNGTTVIGPVTETFNQSATRHGLWGYALGGVSPTPLWDDLTITDFSAGSAPTLSSAAVPSAGTTLTATLDQSGCIPTSGTGGFTLSGTSATVASWAISSTTLTLTLSGTVYAGETVTYSYDRATTTDDISDAGGSNFLANFSGVSVTNNSTQTQPLTAGTATFQSSGTAGIVITSTAPTGGTPSYSYQWKRNVNGGSYSTLSNGGGVSGATTLTVTDGSATAGTLYGYENVQTDSAGSPASVTTNAVTAQVYSGGALTGGVLVNNGMSAGMQASN